VRGVGEEFRMKKWLQELAAHGAKAVVEDL